MNGAERLKQLANRFEQLHSECRTDQERREVLRAAEEVAVNGEASLSTLSGFTLEVIKQGLVDES